MELRSIGIGSGGIIKFNQTLGFESAFLERMFCKPGRRRGMGYVAIEEHGS